MRSISTMFDRHRGTRFPRQSRMTFRLLNLRSCRMADLLTSIGNPNNAEKYKYKCSLFGWEFTFLSFRGYSIYPYIYIYIYSSKYGNIQWLIIISSIVSTSFLEFGQMTCQSWEVTHQNVKSDRPIVSLLVCQHAIQKVLDFPSEIQAQLFQDLQETPQQETTFCSWLLKWAANSDWMMEITKIIQNLCVFSGPQIWPISICLHVFVGREADTSQVIPHGSLLDRWFWLQRNDI